MLAGYSLDMPSLTQRLGLRLPIVLAPMAGGISTPELVAAVSIAGGLGSLGAAYLTPTQIRQAGVAVRRLTQRPFAVNLFAPHPTVATTGSEVERAAAELAPFHASLGLQPPELTALANPDFGLQLEAVLEVCPAVVSFTFGRFERRHLGELRSHGILTVGTATGLQEARQLEADGVDAIVVQGGAAGGHRGGWSEDERADTLALTRAAQSIGVPVIAAGGLMSAADVRAVLDAGASLAQCGTAFLRAAEAGTSAPYRTALAAAKTGDTVLTRAFSGRTARGLRNAVTEGVQQPLPYPFQNALTRSMRAAGAKAGRADVLSLWAGEGVARGREGSAAEILDSLWN